MKRTPRASPPSNSKTARWRLHDKTRQKRNSKKEFHSLLGLALVAISCLWLAVQVFLWNSSVAGSSSNNNTNSNSTSPVLFPPRLGGGSLPQKETQRQRRQPGEDSTLLPPLRQRTISDERAGIDNKHQRPGRDASDDGGDDGGGSGDGDEDFRIVFSTDCSGYQHWQGILLWYSAVRVGQPGTITRIVSGCTAQQRREIRREWSRIDPTGRKFLVHFAPSTAIRRGNQNYKYSNKPGGILHWLRYHQQQQQQRQQKQNSDDDGMVFPLRNDTVVCLLDPDMILLKPITPELIHETWIRRPRGRDQVDYVNPLLPDGDGGLGLPKMLRTMDMDEYDGKMMSLPPRRVMTGHPAGQHFGIGGAWVRSGNERSRPVWRNFSKAAVCGDGGKCTRTSLDDANHRSAVGPVYLATAEDWDNIARKWWEFVPKVHRQYPYLLAEMYSLTMAISDLELGFHLFSSYMITGADVGSPTEAWSWIDEYMAKVGAPTAVEDGGDRNHHHWKNKSQTENSTNWIRRVCLGVAERGSKGNQPVRNGWEEFESPLLLFSMPSTLHYCQRFKLDVRREVYLFAKHRMPHDVFSCVGSDEEKGKNAKDDTHGTPTTKANTSAPAIPFDLDRLVQQLVSAKGAEAMNWTRTRLRTLFAQCQLVSVLDWARRRYREQACAVPSPRHRGGI